jgi:small subunit ribosomal protein S18
MPSTKATPRREKKTKAGGLGESRRRSCYFCKEKIEAVDFKNVTTLRRMMSDKGKIRSRRITGTCRRHQNQVAVAIKRAREMALLPHVNR